MPGYIRDVRRRQTNVEQEFSDKDRLLAQGGESSGEQPVIDTIHNITRSHPWLGRHELPIAVLCVVVTIAGILTGFAIWYM